MAIRWRRYRIQVKPREPLAGYGHSVNGWGVPAPLREAQDYHFDSPELAERAAIRQAGFWARVRIWDSQIKRELGVWHDGKRVEVLSA